MMVLLSGALLALVAAGGGERMYVQNNWQFITLDPATGTVLGFKPLQPLILNRGLAYDEGRLYFLDQNVEVERDRLMALDPATGRTSVVGATGFSIPYAGGFARDPTTGQFYVTFGDRIFKLDKHTGRIEFVTAIKSGSPPVFVEQIAIDSRGRAFGVCAPASLQPRNRLFSVDLESGLLLELGPLDEGLGLFRTIGFDGSDRLWGLYTRFANPSVHTLYQIDIQTLALSVPFPLPQGALGIAFGPAPHVEGYCTAKVDSAGCAPSIDWSGHPSASASFGCEVSCADVLNQSVGMLLAGAGGRASIPFQGGTLCLALPWIASQPVHAGGSPPPATDCTGSWSIDLNTLLYFQLPLPAGSAVQCQWWGRDPALAPPAAQHSGALELVLMP